MNYKLRFHPKAAKELSALDTTVQPRILTAVEALQTDPFRHGSVQLKGETARRVRVGNYRIVFEVDKTENVITIFRVAHRREAYR